MIIGLTRLSHEVSLPNLSIITSGIADASSSRYMNSARLAEVLDELREQYDYVIVDGSPLIPVADARVVSRYVDGAICCVLRDVSRLGLIQQATEILSTFNVRLLGTVVTAKQDTFYLSPQGDRESQLACRSRGDARGRSVAPTATAAAAASARRMLVA